MVKENEVACHDWQGDPLYSDDEVIIVKTFRDDMVLVDDVEEYMASFPKTTVRQYLED